ncbi:hypothetical protein FB562_2230 [Homoserinimonas aerilata]|uniref:Uncharacterized protein n=1 Tax=Homoserinimonas aerilata TaxID=1162970 RepID=A0A542YF40_9MICO|nr:hypothetical protein [Homoserinimonas aerilata]TQL46706.1 hypothetical protein FB562_2230 [Homoserinimonas aerilata]
MTPDNRIYAHLPESDYEPRLPFGRWFIALVATGVFLAVMVVIGLVLLAIARLVGVL